MGSVATQRQRVAVLGRDLHRVMGLGVALHAVYDTTLIHSAHPLADAARLVNGSDCMVVFVRQTDSVIDVHGLVDRAARGSVLFLADELPLVPAVARLIRDGGHAVLAADEPPVVVSGTLVALLAESGAESQ